MPTTYPESSRTRLTRRIWALAITVVCGAVIGVGLWLTPDRRGYGTHMQLGQPACGMLVRTGYPCPSCGLTTSVSATLHGQFALAWRSQPFGLVLTAGLLAGLGGGLWVLVTGRALPKRLRPRLWWLLPFLAAWLAGWGLNVWMGIRCGLYPLGH